MLRRTALIALAAIAMAVPAQAQLAGETLGLQYRFPNQGDVYADLGSAVVGAGLEFSNVIDVFDLNVANNSILINNFRFTASWTTSSFNGFRLYDFNGTAPDFLSFTVLSSNMAGLDNSRLSFDGNNLWVNWNGLDFDAQTSIELGVTATPEPASMTLMATGLVGMIGAARRRRNAKTAA